MAHIDCSFVSYSLRRAVQISVVLPTPTFGEVDAGGVSTHGHQADYPVLYLLHGYSNNRDSWLRYTPAERFAEERSIALVTISGENKFYCNHPGDDRYYDFVGRELPEFVCSNFPVSTRSGDTYIAGLSMGGYGALLHTLGAPGRYGAFGAFSAGIHRTGLGGPADRVTEETRIDLFELLREYEGSMDRLPPGYCTCGDQDFLFEINDEFRRAYQDQGGNLYWEAVPDYAHEWAFWNRELERFLDWLPRTDPYRGTKRYV